MRWWRADRYQDSIQTHLEAAFSKQHPPHHTSASFAIGLFVTALPTLGTGLIVLGAIAYRWEGANRLAFLASIAVLNPLVKGVVYLSSVALGILVLGPVPSITGGDITLSAGSAVAVRLLAGNLILAVLFAALGYGLAFYGVHAARQYRE